MRWGWIIICILLVGCQPEVEEPVKKAVVKVANATKEVSQATVETNVPDDIIERRRTARGFGLFNFSELKFENCEFVMGDFDLKVKDLREDFEEAKDDLDDERRDVVEVLQELEIAIAHNEERTIEKKEDDLEEEEIDVEFAEEDLKRVEELFKRMQIINSEIKQECKRLLIESRKNDP